MDGMDKQLQLNQAKRQAGLWLLGAAGIFIGLSVGQTLQPAVANSVLAGLAKMMAEAALVGGLADWFAVSALFRPIPGFKPIPHTNIVARNQQTIAHNLAQFVKEKFFHEQAIAQLVERSTPAKALGAWLTQPDNASRLAHYAADSLTGMLHVIDDTPIQQALRRSIERGLSKLPLSALLAGSLRILTKEGRHQVLVNKLIDKLATALESEQSQALIAEKLNLWMKTEYTRLEKILPSGWLSEQGAGIAVSAISHTLKDINDDPEHPVRHGLNEQIKGFINNLENDIAMQQRLDAFRDRLLQSEALHLYLQRIWQDIHIWLTADLSSAEGEVAQRLGQVFQHSGERLLADENLQQAVNYHIGVAARYVAPEVADYLTNHIRRTIEGWDGAEMARQIELNIGKDLQKVRINGTLVGGLIGGVLFGLEYAIGHLG